MKVNLLRTRLIVSDILVSEGGKADRNQRYGEKIFIPVAGDSMFLRNADSYTQVYMASQPRRPTSISTSRISMSCIETWAPTPKETQNAVLLTPATSHTCKYSVNFCFHRVSTSKKLCSGAINLAPT
jgi:hypothetical protein